MTACIKRASLNERGAQKQEKYDASAACYRSVNVSKSMFQCQALESKYTTVKNDVVTRCHVPRRRVSGERS